MASPDRIVLTAEDFSEPDTDADGRIVISEEMIGDEEGRLVITAEDIFTPEELDTQEAIKFLGKILDDTLPREEKIKALRKTSRQFHPDNPERLKQGVSVEVADRIASLANALYDELLREKE